MPRPVPPPVIRSLAGQDVITEELQGPWLVPSLFGHASAAHRGRASAGALGRASPARRDVGRRVGGMHRPTRQRCASPTPFPIIRKHLPPDDVLHHLNEAAVDDAGVGMSAAIGYSQCSPSREQLQALVDHLAVPVAQPHLGHRGMDRVEIAFIEELDAAVGEGPARRPPRSLRQLREAGSMEVGDHLVEGLAFGGVGV